MKKKEKQHTCENPECKKIYFTKSRYQRFCFECQENHRSQEVKLGNSASHVSAPDKRTDPETTKISKELKGGINTMGKKDTNKPTKKPQFNKSNCKKFLSQSGLHVKPEAVDKFKKVVEEQASVLAKQISDKTVARGSKTVGKEDFE